MPDKRIKKNGLLDKSHVSGFIDECDLNKILAALAIKAELNKD